MCEKKISLITLYFMARCLKIFFLLIYIVYIPSIYEFLKRGLHFKEINYIATHFKNKNKKNYGQKIKLIFPGIKEKLKLTKKEKY